MKKSITLLSALLVISFPSFSEEGETNFNNEKEIESVSPEYSSQMFRLKYDRYFCMQKKGTHYPPKNGDNVHLWHCHNKHSYNRLWRTRKIGGDLYLIELGNSGYCLSKSGNDSPSNGDNVHLWRCRSSNYSNTIWHLNSSGRIRLLNTNMCVHRTNDYTGDGTNLHLWYCNSPSPQNETWLYHAK